MEREKVIRALENCNAVEKCRDCPWDECEKFDCKRSEYPDELIAQAITLLKAHRKGYWIYPLSNDCSCSECGNQPEHEPGESVPLYNYCPYCGAEMEVKWE